MAVPTRELVTGCSGFGGTDPHTSPGSLAADHWSLLALLAAREPSSVAFRCCNVGKQAPC